MCVSENEALDSKDIYLRKGNEIVGLHAIGLKGPYDLTISGLDGSEQQVTLDFQSFEMWGNEYDEHFNILGRGSFRVFHYCLDMAAEEWEKEGWVRFNVIPK
jgi:hypothetical protein